MPDILAEALALPGLGWLFSVTLIAGLIRGFTGFGTSLVYMPVAAQVLDPFWAILTLVIMDIFGPIPNVPSAFRIADKWDLARLWGGVVIFLPLGLAILSFVEPALFQVITGSVALIMVVCLVLGLRYRGNLGHGLIFATGGLSGLLGGVSGAPGPPVILLYMASSNPAAVVRASTTLFLFGYDIIIMAMLGMKGAFVSVPVLLGVLLAVPNTIGNVLGGWLFRPGQEALYRAVAYSIIAASALSALL